MPTPNLTRAGVEAAPPLEFPDRKASRQDLTITVKATLDGYPVEVVFNGSIEQLQGIARRLRELGAEPATPAIPIAVAAAATGMPAQNGKRKAETVAPVYKPDGTECCPKHQAVLRDGKHGKYCPAKDPDGRNGYCDLKFSE